MHRGEERIVTRTILKEKECKWDKDERELKVVAWQFKRVNTDNILGNGYNDKSKS